MKVLIIAAAFAATVSSTVAAEPLNPKAAKLTDALTQSFFQKLKSGQVEEAYSKALPSQLVKDKRQEVDALVNQTKSALSIYGPISGWEIVGQNQKSPYYATVIYELRMADLPLFYHFSFYRKDDNTSWEVTKVSFSDNDDLSIN